MDKLLAGGNYEEIQKKRKQDKRDKLENEMR
jgi:hypothetical protein